VRSSAAAAEAAEEGTEGGEGAGGLSPQSRNPISVCAAWRIITDFYLLLLDDGENIIRNSSWSTLLSGMSLVDKAL
jgi:hypothetical protein